MFTKTYWLVAGQVVTGNDKGQRIGHNINAMLQTDEPFVNALGLDRAQKLLMNNFLQRGPQNKGFKITDVFILGMSNLGTMSDDQYAAGMIVSDSGEAIPEKKDQN